MEYPEHEKLNDIQQQSQFLGDFLEWFKEKKGLYFCYIPTGTHNFTEYSTGSINKLLAEYFDIDLIKLEAEKQTMLSAIRKANHTQTK